MMPMKGKALIMCLGIPAKDWAEALKYHVDTMILQML